MRIPRKWIVATGSCWGLVPVIHFTVQDGVVLDADINAARNILAMLKDPEITLFMPYLLVKAIWQERTEQFQERLRLSNQDSSCISLSLLDGASTESESPLVDQK